VPGPHQHRVRGQPQEPDQRRERLPGCVPRLGAEAQGVKQEGRMTPGEIAELRRQRYNATVVGVRKPNPDLMLIRIRPDKPRPVHQAGQYSTLGLGNWEPRTPGCAEEHLDPSAEENLIRRAYSISCPVMNDSMTALWDREGCDWLEFYIVLVRDTGRPDPPALT